MMPADVLERVETDRHRPANLRIIDCDIHPRPRSKEKDIFPHLPERWREQMRTYGARPRIGNVHGRAFPKGQPAASRRDAWPPDGGAPGSDLSLLREQLLDAHNIRLGILNFAGENGQGFQDLEFSAAYTTAVNEWLKAEWTSREPRLKASIVIPYELAEASVAEIERRAGDPDFVQVLMHSRSAEPFGRRRYWPIYEAVSEAGLPVGIHAFGYGGNAITSGGWPSYYVEEMIGHAQCCQALLSSMVLEGVFVRFPKLRLVLIESGFGWVQSLCWRLDRIWRRMRNETPHLERPPSEYIREHVWFTTQPIEEPDRQQDLVETMAWIGWDRLLFSTDYPHWDFDDPGRAFRAQLSPAQRERVFRDNATRLYGLSL